jgi:hypothetical protein
MDRSCPHGGILTTMFGSPVHRLFRYFQGEPCSIFSWLHSLRCWRLLAPGSIHLQIPEDSPYSPLLGLLSSVLVFPNPYQICNVPVDTLGSTRSSNFNSSYLGLPEDIKTKIPARTRVILKKSEIHFSNIFKGDDYGNSLWLRRRSRSCRPQRVDDPTAKETIVISSLSPLAISVRGEA